MEDAIAGFSLIDQVARIQKPLFAVFGVIAIMGLVLFLKAPKAQTSNFDLIAQTRTPEALAMREVTKLNIALNNYRRDCKRLPDSTEGLVALLNNPGFFGWRGPYITLLQPDPWGHDYLYSPPSDTNSFVILSIGPDGVKGTPDDIYPPQPQDGREKGN